MSDYTIKNGDSRDDELQAFRARVAELEAALAERQARGSKLIAAFETANAQLKDDCDKLMAENARLREKYDLQRLVQTNDRYKAALENILAMASTGALPVYAVEASWLIKTVTEALSGAGDADMSNWCQGFCTLCGTGCGEYCEELKEFRARIERLERVAAAARELAPHFHSDTNPGIQSQFNAEDALVEALAALDAAEGK